MVSARKVARKVSRSTSDAGAGDAPEVTCVVEDVGNTDGKGAGAAACGPKLEMVEAEAWEPEPPPTTEGGKQQRMGLEQQQLQEEEDPQGQWWGKCRVGKQRGWWR